MAESVFEDRATEPTSSELHKSLGKAATLLMDLEKQLAAEHGDLTREWKFYGKRAGWTLALGHGGRRILHLIPQSGAFTVVFTLGKRAVVACQESALPPDILSALETARDYAEGRSIRFDISTAEDVRTATLLAASKMAN